MQIIRTKPITDNRGDLISLEAGKNIPFNIKRVYYLYNLNEARRGFHAHYKLKQFMVCVSGSCTVKLDVGTSSQEIELNDPTKGIFIESMTWREMYNFSKDCVLMVLADDLYDESDYIRDYEKFLNAVKGSNLE